MTVPTISLWRANGYTEDTESSRGKELLTGPRMIQRHKHISCNSGVHCTACRHFDGSGQRVSYRQLDLSRSPPLPGIFFLFIHTLGEEYLVNLFSFRYILKFVSCIIHESDETSSSHLQKMFQFRRICYTAIIPLKT